jgi:hypothetical protein
MGHEPSPLAQVQAAGKKQEQNNQDDHAYAADGEIAPVLTVRPSWEASHQRYDKNYRENEYECHVLAAPLTVVADSKRDEPIGLELELLVIPHVLS